MFDNLTIKLRLTLLIGLTSVIMLITSGLGLREINKSNDSIESIYANKMVSTTELGYIKAKTWENRLLLAAGVIYPDEATKRAETIEKNLEDIKKHWEIYNATFCVPEEKELIKKYLANRQRYLDEAMKPALEILKTGDAARLSKHIFDKIRPLFVPFYEDLDALIKINTDGAILEYETAQAHFKVTLWVLMGLVAFGLLASILFGNAIIRGLLNSLTSVQTIANAVAHGDLSSRINTDVKDETLPMLQAMQAMQNTIVRFIDAQQVIAKRHKEGFISEQMDATKFQGSYADMANSMNSLVKSHIDVKMHIVDVVSQYAKGDFKRDIDRLPGEKAKITTAIDSVKAALLGVNTEIETLVATGAQGDFSKRANANKYDFMFKSMLTSLNTLIETCDVGFNDVLRVANALAEGDLTQSITRDYPGVFGQAKIGMNNTTENLKNVIAEIKETTDVISSAAKEIASGNNDLSHRTEEQAASLEETAASMQELTSTVQHNSENAKQANILAVGATETANKGVSVV